MYLFGASGHAKVVVDILKKQGVQVKGFFDDDPAKQELNGIPVVGVTEDNQADHNPCIIAIGDNRIRAKVVGELNAAEYATALHPSATIAEPESISEGTVVMAGAVINPATRVGRHCIINTSASVDHDCVLGDFVHIAPNATLCGGIIVGEGTLIGSGATVIPNIKIGRWAVVAAGAVVIGDVPDFAVVAGNPARVKKINQPV